MRPLIVFLRFLRRRTLSSRHIPLDQFLLPMTTSSPPLFLARSLCYDLLGRVSDSFFSCRVLIPDCLFNTGAWAVFFLLWAVFIRDWFFPRSPFFFCVILNAFSLLHAAVLSRPCIGLHFSFPFPFLRTEAYRISCCTPGLRYLIFR